MPRCAAITRRRSAFSASSSPTCWTSCADANLGNVDAQGGLHRYTPHDRKAPARCAPAISFAPDRAWEFVDPAGWMYSKRLPPRRLLSALTGPSPVDRARTGSKHHLLTDANGIPLAISLTGGNRNDVTQLLPLIDPVGPVRGKVGRPRQRAERVLADRGYDNDKYRRELRKRGVKPVIARRATGSGLGRERGVVELTFAWLHNLRRLRTRYERDDQLHLAFMLLGCGVVCQRTLRDA
jgi:transposase